MTQSLSDLLQRHNFKRDGGSAHIAYVDSIRADAPKVQGRLPLGFHWGLIFVPFQIGEERQPEYSIWRGDVNSLLEEVGESQAILRNIQEVDGAVKAVLGLERECLVIPRHNYQGNVGDTPVLYDLHLV